MDQPSFNTRCPCQGRGDIGVVSVNQLVAQSFWMFTDKNWLRHVFHRMLHHPLVRNSAAFNKSLYMVGTDPDPLELEVLFSPSAHCTNIKVNLPVAQI